jgi:hypothetical protein
MQQANDVVEKVLKPWLEKHHPNADLVVMAGSFGRAMKNGGYQPIASSDVDMVIIYRASAPLSSKRRKIFWPKARCRCPRTNGRMRFR